MQGIFQKENTDKALKYGIYWHLPTYEKIIRNLVSFLLNILLFIPLGFLCPLISKTFLNKKNICLIGFGLSFFIEIAQLFTLHRATDINDLFANVFGTIIGYFFLQLTAKLPIIKSLCSNSPTEKCTTYLPAIIITISFVLSFLA